MKTENRFKQIHDLGYHEIVPIMPCDVEISPTSEAKPKSRGKIPGKLTPNGWVGYWKWQELRATPEHLKLWHGWGAGVGIICGDIIAFDIDVRNESLAQKLIDHIHASLGPASVRIGSAPKALLPYRCTEPLKKRRISFESSDDAVEMLGKGQQFVASGIHPKTGKPYLWDGASEIPPAYSSLTKITPEEVNKLW